MVKGYKAATPFANRAGRDFITSLRWSGYTSTKHSGIGLLRITQLSGSVRGCKASCVRWSLTSAITEKQPNSSGLIIISTVFNAPRFQSRSRS
jgi:hypothetical protein